MSVSITITGPIVFCHSPREEEIMSKLNELAASIQSVNTQLAKAFDEIVKRIEELQNTTADVDLPAEAQAALDGLVAAAKALDDIVPDVVVEEPPAEVPPTE